MKDDNTARGGREALLPGDLAYERLVVQSLPCGTLVVDGRGTIVHANDRALRQFGYTADELIGRSVETLVDEARRSWHAEIRQTAPSGRRCLMQGRTVMGRRRDGSEFALEVELERAEGPAGTLTVAVCRDVAERGEDARQPSDGQFDRFIAERASQFINLPSERVDVAVREMLKDVATLLDLDRLSALELAGSGFRNPIRWTRPDLPQGPETMGDARGLFPGVFERLDEGKTTHFASVDELPHPTDRASFADLHIRSGVVVPLVLEGEMVGVANFFTMRAERVWTQDALSRLLLVATVLATTFARRRADQAVRDALSEVEELKHQLAGVNVYLRSEVQALRGSSVLVGESRAIQRMLAQVQQVADSDATVLLSGETGTGKELVAERIHELSRRRAHAMVRVNCAALPATLLESELFGRERGAYTGADTAQAGRFELAHKSTLFLDEVGELPLEAQVKLLRVLEQRTIERLGSGRAIHIDSRLVTATNRDLERLVGEGRFRADLYYRLNVFPIRVPPLRERPEDVPALVWHFVRLLSPPLRKRITAIADAHMQALQQYRWPGNVRELRNVVERALIVSRGPELAITPPATQAVEQASAGFSTLEDVERDHIRRVLERTLWRIRGAGGAAAQLGLKPTTLETRMAKLGLVRPTSQP